MSEVFTVQPKNKSGCMGFDMQDGTKYHADKSGHIVVDNPAHIKAIKKSQQAQDGWLEKRYETVKDCVTGKVCTTCQFVAFAYQETCPKCTGTDFVPEEE